MTTNVQQTFHRVLVIDDNDAIHLDFDKILCPEQSSNDALDELDAMIFGGDDTDSPVVSAQFDVAHASQGKEGLNAVENSVRSGQPFGAAFVDMRMPPGWDGVETILHLWQVDPDLQVVICTAFSDHSWEEIARQLGQTDRLLVLKKPFDQIEVVQLATSLCEKRRLLEASRQNLENLEQLVGEQAVKLQAAHENAETLIQSISSALVSLDADGCIARWNPVATSLFGIPMDDAVGHEFTSLGIKWVAPEQLHQLLTSENTSEPAQQELQFVDETGSTRTLDVRICSILNDPTTRSRLIVASDVTQRKLLQSQLDQAQRLESVGQLAAGVAHEINTPMQYIGDNVRFVSRTFEKLHQLFDLLPSLVDETISDDQFCEMRKSVAGMLKPRKVKSMLQQIPEALEDSIQGVEAVARIVAAMKEFSHPGSDEKAHVNLNHILDSTITVARNEWKYVAEVDSEFDPDLPSLPAFGSELNQAFLNIIVNAAHAISDRVSAGDFDKGKIEIRTSHTDEFAVVTIRDTGGGIPQTIRDRVFDPFFTTKDVGKGTGQGLAIARTVIVKKHGGRLTFDVEEGQGTTFRIELPLQDNAPAADVEVDSAFAEKF